MTFWFEEKKQKDSYYKRIMREFKVKKKKIKGHFVVLERVENMYTWEIIGQSNAEEVVTHVIHLT